jgi:hypothetical protein
MTHANPSPASTQPNVCGRLFAACAIVLVAGALVALPARRSDAADPAPQPSAGRPATVPRLPVIEANGPSSHVEGKIVRSSRGRKGPVRLLVERKSGDQVMVLVGPDQLCDRLGLSLKSGETIDVQGALVKSEHPILIASVFKMPDGKTIRVRDASGQLIDAGGPSASGGAAHKATVSGANPAASPAAK